MTGVDLKGRTALVTGASLRLGRAIVEQLHEAGMQVAIHCNRSLAEADVLAARLNGRRAHSATVHQCDLLESDQLCDLVQSVATEHGGMHVLVNNASAFYPTSIGQTTQLQWDELMGSNLRAPFFLSQAAAPWLRESHGCIVNMVDIYGMRPLSGHTVYSVAKAGLIMLTESLAKELAPQVRVNAIAPGPIMHPSGSGDDDRETPPKGTPLDRWGEPEEIAQAALFLIRDARFTSGATLPVDGGRRVFGY